ncbi:hypothetical protein TMatcc_009727 [Talaromyces marneffei ATCC 18224]|uniref:Exosome complex protein n=2 Tax=Talaromyces marneffei TaxID=37727 RepID=B6QTE6_TALMQ|nr:uncharacterized protein EYB26_008966 [Talaromyces marneffei]EEA19587.1 exosome-associated family protein [Talaromyces marneffei ATCC 18224]QGA21256.1 hypothetical protein EYB26_008966 [Talaromyces marneffei]
MEVANLLPLVDRLEDNIDDLEEALEPLLSRSLDETSKKLPLLERAKLHALLTYILESLIFSYLTLHGTNAQEHPVFKELTRVKQYYAKIKALESPPPEEEAKPTMKLDQQAARRFIAHGLAGNDQYDIERAERQAKEKARAQLKAAMLAKKSKEESSASTPSQELSKPSTEAESSESESEESEDESPSDSIDTKPAKSVSPIGDFIKLSSEPMAESKNAKKKTAKAKAKQRKENLIKAKRAEPQATREAKGIPEPDNKQQRTMSRKERRRRKEAKRKEKNNDKKKQNR